MCRTCAETSLLSILQNLKKKEKRLGGKGKLTDRIIDKLQNYYGIAIRSNKKKT